MKRLLALSALCLSSALALPSGDVTSASSGLLSAATRSLVLTLDSGTTIRGLVAPDTLPCLADAWRQARHGASSASVSLVRKGGTSLRVDLRHVKALNVVVARPSGPCPSNLLIVSAGD